MTPHFLQSSAWERYERLEGNTTFRLEDGTLVILKSTPVGNYLFCPYGPTLKHPSLNSLKSSLNTLTKFATDHSAFFIRLEPTYPFDPAALSKLGLVKSHDLDPAHTWTLDLTLPREELLKNMRKSNVQYWQSAPKKSLTVRHTTDPNEITVLVSLLQAVSAKDKFIPQTAAHLKRQLAAGFATLYIAEYQGQPLAASLVYDHAGTRFYAHAATSDQERKLAAGTVLLVQMILDAKDQGATTFDFWGVTTSEDPSHPWYGFSKYKRSFGGSLVTYAGTWDLPLQRSRYRLYQFIRHLNRLKRRLFH